MKCPHCASNMEMFDSSNNSISQVLFYRCQICSAEHVSSQMLSSHDTEKTVTQFELLNFDNLREEIFSI